jgi:DnaJ-class molecular chaperone
MELITEVMKHFEAQRPGANQTAAVMQEAPIKTNQQHQKSSAAPPAKEIAQGYFTLGVDHTHTLKCYLCRGTGISCANEADWDNQDTCPECDGKGAITRNYLAEAFEIARCRGTVPVCREHVEAVIKHCRALVSATMQLPEAM